MSEAEGVSAPTEFRVGDQVVCIQPAGVTPRHLIKEQDATVGVAYAAQALRVRARIGKAVLTSSTWELGKDGLQLCLYALQDAGFALEQAEQFCQQIETDDLFRMVAVAAGYYTPCSRIRSAMIALQTIGLGDLEFSADEAMRLADWAWNQGRAPALHSVSGGSHD